MAAAEHDPSGVRVYRRLLSRVRPYWAPFVVALLAMSLVAATETGFAALMQPLLDGSFVNKDPQVIRLLPLWLIGLFAVRGVATFASTYGMAWVGRRVVKDLRGEMFNRLVQLPTAFFHAHPSGSLLAKLTYDVEQVAEASTNALTIVVRDTLTAVGLFAWMVYISGWLALTFLVMGPVTALLVVHISRRFRRISRRIQVTVGEVTQVAEEAIEGHAVVKVFGGEEYEKRRFERANEGNRHQVMKYLATNASSVPVTQLIGAVALAGVIYLATLPAMLDQITVGRFMSFIAAMMLLLPALKRITSVNSTVQRGIAAGQSVFALLDEVPERDHGRLRLGRARGEVQYRDVSFAYPHGKARVLEDVSFTAGAGQTVAFVGRSGSGKTTLVSLLPRLYELGEGRITVDGHDINDLRLASLRDQIAWVGQHVTLFNDTVAGNIAYGRTDRVAREEIEKVAQAAHVMEFVDDLPEGLDTLVGENGVRLSGGQRQRIAIARALLKDAPILILDEATSALDSESERQIQVALEGLMRRRTTLVIAHRLSTIERADVIIVLHAGRVVESGDHATLLARGGHYAALHKIQFRDAPRAQQRQGHA